MCVVHIIVSRYDRLVMEVPCSIQAIRSCRRGCGRGAGFVTESVVITGVMDDFGEWTAGQEVGYRSKIRAGHGELAAKADGRLRSEQ